MSQIVAVQLDLNLEELVSALTKRGIRAQSTPGRRLMLPASGDCIAEPVDLLCPAGHGDTLESWGFRLHDGHVSLVCGEFDRQILLDGVVEPVRQEIARARVQAALAALNADQEEAIEPSIQVEISGD